MRIAVSAENAQGLASPVCEHFGHSPYFAFVDVAEDGVPTNVTTLANPCYDNHTCADVVTFVHSNSAEVMLSGGMGMGAIAHFNHSGIDVRTGASGTVGQAVEAFLQGNLPGRGVTCGHGHGGGCH